MGKKIAVLITDEFEDSEFTSPAEAFRKAGHEVITIEKEAGKTVKGHKGEASVTIDETIDNVSPSDFDALLLPGGHSPDSLRGDERFLPCNRGVLVNMDEALKLDGDSILLTDGLRFPLRQRNRLDLVNRFSEYQIKRMKRG